MELNKYTPRDLIDAGYKVRETYILYKSNKIKDIDKTLISKIQESQNNFLKISREMNYGEIISKNLCKAYTYGLGGNK